MRRFATALTAVTISAALFTGCSHPEPRPAPTPDEGIVLAFGEVDSGEFDPAKGWGKHGEIRLTHVSLLKQDTDLKFTGDVAESWEPNADNTAWTFTIKDGYKFSDGTPITAEDVAFTITMLKEDGVAFDLSYVDSVTAEGNTVTISLTEPNSLLLSDLTTIGIVPKDSYDKETYSANPVTSGPYQIAEYRKGEQLILTANPGYPHQPEIRKLTFVLSGEDTALAAAKAGDVDMVLVPNSAADQQIEGMTQHAFETMDSRGIVLPTIPAGSTSTTVGNRVDAGNDVTADPAIRKALAYGINRQELVDLVLAGHGEPAYTAFDGTPWFIGDDAIVSEDGKGDADKAKQILADAGWADTNGDGTVDKNGREATFTLMYSADDQVRNDLSLAVAEQAAELGIGITTKGATWDEIYQDGKTNAVMWGDGSHSPALMYQLYSGDQIGVAYNNMASYDNETVNNHLRDYKLTGDLQALKDAQWDGTTGFATPGDNPIIWLVRQDNVFFISDHLDVGEQPIHAHGARWQLFGNVTDWKIK